MPISPSVCFRLAALVLIAAPAAAQPLTILRQTAGDYAFETRVDTTGADCPEPAERLFPPTDEPCGSGRWLAVVWRGTAVDSLDAPMSWLGTVEDTTAAAPGPPMPPYPVVAPAPAGAVRDLTGDGVPDAILTAYSGGMHCCSTHRLVSLGADGPRLLGTVDAEHGMADVADLDGDGTAEWTLRDWTFAYWHESFAGSPAPTVVLAWDGRALAPSAVHMRRTPLPDLPPADRVRADPAWSTRRFPPTDYWATILDLLYAGRGADAARFADEAWPGDALGRAVFLRMLVDQLWRSPYVDTVLDMNEGAVDWL